jgi:hypothetical protein
MQEVPSPALLSQIPALVAAPKVDAACPMVPFLELLWADHASPATTTKPQQPELPATQPKKADVGIHGYVNRLLRQLDPNIRVTQDLTSHSFRQGRAQHANGDDRLAPQWIFDRGAWNLGTIIKVFAYVFNTPREDMKVARVLSGWQPDDSPVIPDISTLDHAALEQPRRVQASLFSSCFGLGDARFNICAKVRDVLAAHLLEFFPQVKALNPDAPLVARVEQCAEQAQVPLVELLSFSVALDDTKQQDASSSCSDGDQPKSSCRCQLDDAVIQELIELNRREGERLRVIEAALLEKRVAASNVC